jgi:hypothetical protein
MADPTGLKTKEYSDHWEGTVVTSTPNADGGGDVTIVATGNARHLGTLKVFVVLHTGAPILLSNTILIPWHGTNVDAFADDGVFYDRFEGYTVVPLDANGAPLPPPYRGIGQWTITGGTGKLQDATGSGIILGWDFGNGRFTIEDQAVISTPAANAE